MAVSSPPVIKILSDLDIDLMDIGNDVDYLRALMEATNALIITNARDKRIPILQEEIQRVRADRKAADPKFRVKKVKIDPKKIMGRKMIAPVGGLPELDQGKVLPKEQDIIKSIAVRVESIRDILKQQLVDKKDDAKKKRRLAENLKRDRKETGLELFKKGFGGLKSSADKVVKPVTSLFGEVFKFLGNLIAGRALMLLLDWFQNPENQKKILAIGKFLKKTWPVLLAAFLLFGTTFGQMVVKLGVIFTKFLVVQLPKLLLQLATAIGKMKLAALGKFGLIAGGVVAAGAGIYATGKMLQKDKVGKNLADEEVSKTNALVEGGMDTGSAKVLADSTRLPDAGGGGSVNNMKTSTDMLQLRNDPLGGGFNKFKEGGFVSGPAGVDKVPAKLTAGEFVMSKGAVQKYGVDTLASMNAAGGGTNRPTMGRYKTGGQVKGEAYNPMTGGSEYFHPDDGVIRGSLFPNFSYSTNKKTTKEENITSGSSTYPQKTSDVGEVRQMGRGASKKRMEVKRNLNKPKVTTIKTPVNKQSSVQAYNEQANMAAVGGGGDVGYGSKKGDSNEIPDFNPSAKRSIPKIKTLGISV